MVVLVRRASCDKKTLARQVIPLAPSYRTALSSRPAPTCTTAAVVTLESIVLAANIDVPRVLELLTKTIL